MLYLWDVSQRYSDRMYVLAPDIGLVGEVYSLGEWGYLGNHRRLLNYAVINGILYPKINSTEKLTYLPVSSSLIQNYPNPFNPTTNIGFELNSSGFVNLKIYDLLGREVATLVNETKNAGKYNAVFNAKNLAGGVYFCRLILKPDNGLKEIILNKSIQVLK
jgi:hypothetical protein